MLKDVAPFEIQTQNLLGETAEIELKNGSRSKIRAQGLPSIKEEFYTLSCDYRWIEDLEVYGGLPSLLSG